MNYQSYMIGQDDPQPIPDALREPAPQVRIRDTMYSVSSNDGAVTETTQTDDRGTVSELNQHLHGASPILATVQRPDGRPVYEIEPTDLVTVNGVQSSIAFWVSEGVLQKRADGSYGESTERPADAPAPQDTSDVHAIAPQQMETINAALAEVDQNSLDGLAAVGTGVASGRLDASALARKFSQASGLDTEQASARLASIQAIYQAQADTAITSRFGVTAADLPAFYQWARENEQGRLQEAITKQLHTHNLSGYRAIAARWLSVTPPSAAALKASGHDLRMQGGTQEVFVRGQWMRPEAAARMGLL